MEKCSNCGAKKFTAISYSDGGNPPSFVCFECLEKLIQEDKVFWCFGHERFEFKTTDTHKIKVKDEYGLVCDNAYHSGICKVCDICGELTLASEMVYETICSDCINEPHVRVQCSEILFYHRSHKFPRKFFGNPVNGIYFGLEIESEFKSEKIDYGLKNINEEIKFLCNFEEDGSLEYGFETITHPMSYEFMKNNQVVENIMNELEKDMCISERCGLHIHVTRTEEVERKIPKILMFIENNREDMIRFCERESRYAKFYSNENKSINLDIANAILYNSNSFDRYRILNIQNSSTIEFRGFKGTLDADKVYKYIEFILTLLETDINENTTFNDLPIDFLS